MFRSVVFIFLIITILMTSFTNGKNITHSRRRQLSSTRKPVSIKICGLALIRMLDMVCTKARQLLMRNEISSSLSPVKRQFNIEDDPYSRTVSITDYTRKLNSLLIRNMFFFFFDSCRI
jgi:hypothetical protein